MSTIHVPRDNVTSEEVCQALVDGLGPGYNVLPGIYMSRNPLGTPHPDQRDTILVGTGSNRLVRAQVTITHHSGQSHVQIKPGGISWELLLNSLGIARRIRRVLSDAPALH